MYQPPQLERFGTFRDLTRAGCEGGTDNVTFIGTNGASGVSVGNRPDSDEPYIYCLNTPSGSSR